MRLAAVRPSVHRGARPSRSAGRLAPPSVRGGRGLEGEEGEREAAGARGRLRRSGSGQRRRRRGGGRDEGRSGAVDRGRGNWRGGEGRGDRANTNGTILMAHHP